ncbi:hypothetical protein ACQKOM_10205 [Peribacillus frigoritolerans]|uniref:hypothetical protein n=1 Tax=Peribacillus frigoritolerans TaxID=450367 RepID=UPI003CFE5ABF
MILDLGIAFKEIKRVNRALKKGILPLGSKGLYWEKAKEKPPGVVKFLQKKENIKVNLEQELMG